MSFPNVRSWRLVQDWIRTPEPIEFPSQRSSFWGHVNVPNTFTTLAPTNLKYLKFFDGTLCQTYREASKKWQFLRDIQHLQHALQETAETSTAEKLCNLFAIISSYCEPANPHRLWDLFRNHMAKDILYRLQQEKNDPDMTIKDE